MVDVRLSKVKEELVAIIGGDIINALKLEPILFDLGRSEIRQDAALILDKAGDFLKKNKTIKIEIQSHTDAQSSEGYNQRLSESRAKSTYEYLVRLGVDASRMSFKGYGERKLVNDCRNWKLCSKEENQKNRRTVLVVVE